MKVTLELRESTVQAITKLIEGCDRTFEGEVNRLLEEVLKDRRYDRVDDVALIVSEMFRFAMTREIGRTVNTTELYNLTTGHKWLRIEPGVRKAIGKRFAAKVNQHNTEVQYGDRYLHRSHPMRGSGAANYQLCIVGEVR